MLFGKGYLEISPLLWRHATATVFLQFLIFLLIIIIIICFLTSILL